jgi:hypothetical protein
MDMYILTTGPWLEWHVYVWLVNLTKVTYLLICQIEHLIKLNKKNDHIGQNDQWLLINWDISQVGQSKMTSLIKMDNDVLVKWDILC